MVPRRSQSFVEEFAQRHSNKQWGVRDPWTHSPPPIILFRLLQGCREDKGSSRTDAPTGSRDALYMTLRGSGSKRLGLQRVHALKTSSIKNSKHSRKTLVSSDYVCVFLCLFVRLLFLVSVLWSPMPWCEVTSSKMSLLATVSLTEAVKSQPEASNILFIHFTLFRDEKASWLHDQTQQPHTKRHQQCWNVCPLYGNTYSTSVPEETFVLLMKRKTCTGRTLDNIATCLHH